MAPIIFISYSHKDERWKNQFETHLRAVERQTQLEVWSDRRIGTGQDWLKYIQEAINRAHLAVLMVSPDFLASNFIWEEEVPRIFARRQEEGLVVVPLIVKHCPWQRVNWIPSLQARPLDGRPLASLRSNQRDEALAGLAAEILDLLPQAACPDGTIAAFIANYRKRLKSAFPVWKLPLTFETRAVAPVASKLDDMYMPLRLAEGFDTNKLDLGGTIGPQELITRERRLFVRGPAGAGKTTWLEWTFRRLLDPQWNALPLILVLRDLARLWQDPTYQGERRSIEGFLASWVAEHLGRDWDVALRQSYQGENGLRPILLVDGWDEVGDLKEEIQRKLLGFADYYPRLLLVITSRPYEEARPYDSDFDVLDIQPLSDLEIEGLARRFFNRIHGEGTAIATQELDRFLQALNRSRETKALARTALLLMMMLLIGRSGPLPEERHLLYEKCIEYLLIDLPNRKEREGAQLSGWHPPDDEERIRVAAALASGMQEKREHQRSSSVGSWNELKEFLPGEWPDRRKSSFLEWLSGPASLLTPQDNNTLAFTHLSFQDYLAAWHLNATIKEPRECIEAFRQRLRSPQWWETLRLWAALIDRQDPERLDAMLDASLVDSTSHGDELCFAGALLADGLGSETRFEAWTKAFCSALSSHWLSESDLCARSWAISQQNDRKKVLIQALSQQARGTSWPGWLRIQSVSRQAFDLQPELPEGIVSRAIIGPLDVPGGETEKAARRVLCGGPAIWPIDPLDIGLLQLWPASRRSSALRLQLAASCGATWTDLLALAPFILVQPQWPQDAEIRTREWTHHWNREWLREWARYWIQYWELEQTRDQRWSRDWIQYWACGWIREWNCDQAREWAREWARYWGRYWEPKWASERARYWSHELACYWARKTKIELQPWLEQFAFYDLASAGRSLGRVIMANAQPSEGEPAAPLFSLACQISLAGQPALPDEQRQFAELARGLDPLWLALAKHLARCSDPADRELLVDLAQHPEKREPPLAWGLRYIVRGDLLLEDGRVITLDELAGEAGVPHLPFLDEMSPELEVDLSDASE